MDLIDGSDGKIDPTFFSTCRLCVSKPGSYQILPQIQKQIKELFDISVHTYDGLPQLLCEDCRKVLTGLYAIRNTFQTKQKELISRNKVLHTPEDIDGDAKYPEEEVESKGPFKGSLLEVEKPSARTAASSPEPESEKSSALSTKTLYESQITHSDSVFGPKSELKPENTDSMRSLKGEPKPPETDIINTIEGEDDILNTDSVKSPKSELVSSTVKSSSEELKYTESDTSTDFIYIADNDDSIQNTDDVQSAKKDTKFTHISTVKNIDAVISTSNEAKCTGADTSTYLICIANDNVSMQNTNDLQSPKKDTKFTHISTVQNIDAAKSTTNELKYKDTDTSTDCICIDDDDDSIHNTNDVQSPRKTTKFTNISTVQNVVAVKSTSNQSKYTDADTSTDCICIDDDDDSIHNTNDVQSPSKTTKITNINTVQSVVAVKSMSNQLKYKDADTSPDFICIDDDDDSIQNMDGVQSARKDTKFTHISTVQNTDAVKSTSNESLFTDADTSTERICVVEHDGSLQNMDGVQSQKNDTNSTDISTAQITYAVKSTSDESKSTETSTDLICKVENDDSIQNTKSPKPKPSDSVTKDDNFNQKAVNPNSSTNELISSDAKCTVEDDKDKVSITLPPDSNDSVPLPKKHKKNWQKDDNFNQKAVNSNSSTNESISSDAKCTVEDDKDKVSITLPPDSNDSVPLPKKHKKNWQKLYSCKFCMQTLSRQYQVGPHLETHQNLIESQKAYKIKHAFVPMVRTGEPRRYNSNSNETSVYLMPGFRVNNIFDNYFSSSHINKKASKDEKDDKRETKYSKIKRVSLNSRELEIATDEPAAKRINIEKKPSVEDSQDASTRQYYYTIKHSIKRKSSSSSDIEIVKDNPEAKRIHIEKAYKTDIPKPTPLNKLQSQVKLNQAKHTASKITSCENSHEVSRSKPKFNPEMSKKAEHSTPKHGLDKHCLDTPYKTSRHSASTIRPRENSQDTKHSKAKHNPEVFKKLQHAGLKLRLEEDQHCNPEKHTEPKMRSAEIAQHLQSRTKSEQEINKKADTPAPKLTEIYLTQQSTLKRRHSEKSRDALKSKATAYPKIDKNGDQSKLKIRSKYTSNPENSIKAEQSPLKRRPSEISLDVKSIDKSNSEINKKAEQTTLKRKTSENSLNSEQSKHRLDTEINKTAEQTTLERRTQESLISPQSKHALNPEINKNADQSTLKRRLSEKSQGLNVAQNLAHFVSESKDKSNSEMNKKAEQPTSKRNTSVKSLNSPNSEDTSKSEIKRKTEHSITNKSPEKSVISEIKAEKFTSNNGSVKILPEFRKLEATPNKKHSKLETHKAHYVSQTKLNSALKIHEIRAHSSPGVNDNTEHFALKIKIENSENTSLLESTSNLNSQDAVQKNTESNPTMNKDAEDSVLNIKTKLPDETPELEIITNPEINKEVQHSLNALQLTYKNNKMTEYSKVDETLVESVNEAMEKNQELVINDESQSIKVVTQTPQKNNSTPKILREEKLKLVSIIGNTLQRSRERSKELQKDATFGNILEKGPIDVEWTKSNSSNSCRLEAVQGEAKNPNRGFKNCERSRLPFRDIAESLLKREQETSTSALPQSVEEYTNTILDNMPIVVSANPMLPPPEVTSIEHIQLRKQQNILEDTPQSTKNVPPEIISIRHSQPQTQPNPPEETPQNVIQVSIPASLNQEIATVSKVSEHLPMARSRVPKLLANMSLLSPPGPVIKCKPASALLSSQRQPLKQPIKPIDRIVAELRDVGLTLREDISLPATLVLPPTEIICIGYSQLRTQQNPLEETPQSTTNVPPEIISIGHSQPQTQANPPKETPQSTTNVPSEIISIGRSQPQTQPNLPEETSQSITNVPSEIISIGHSQPQTQPNPPEETPQSTTNVPSEIISIGRSQPQTQPNPPEETPQNVIQVSIPASLNQEIATVGIVDEHLPVARSRVPQLLANMLLLSPPRPVIKCKPVSALLSSPMQPLIQPIEPFDRIVAELRDIGLTLHEYISLPDFRTLTRYDIDVGWQKLKVSLYVSEYRYNFFCIQVTDNRGRLAIRKESVETQRQILESLQTQDIQKTIEKNAEALSIHVLYETARFMSTIDKTFKKPRA